MSKEKMMERFGLTEKDFEPKEKNATVEARLGAMEEAFLELIEYVIGGDENAE